MLNFSLCRQFSNWKCMLWAHSYYWGYWFCWAVDERITFSLLHILETIFFQTHQYNVNLVYCSRYWGKFEGLNSPFEMEYMQCQASWNGWKSFSAFKNWHLSSYCRATYLIHYKSRNLLGLYLKFCLHKGNMNVNPLRTAGYSRDFCNKVFPFVGQRPVQSWKRKEALVYKYSKVSMFANAL